MIGHIAKLQCLRWLLVLLVSLTWATMGRAASLAERGDLGSSSIAAKAGLPQGPLLHPSQINFSQRSVSSNVGQYADDMANGAWDWSRSGPLRVMEREGGWVSYDNRRLLGAQQAGLDAVPVEVVSGAKWERAFQTRFGDPRNVSAGGAVPNAGLPTQPVVVPPRIR